MNNQLDPLIELQKEFCLFKLDSKVRVGLLKEINLMKTGHQIDEISMYNKEDGKLLMKRFLETLSVASVPKTLIEDFMNNPNTIAYDRIAFTPKITPKETLNYWIPPNITPVQGSYTLIKSFLFEVICNGDLILFEYLLNFLAHMIQKPEEKPGIMIVMSGGQGTGKGTFFCLLQKIWLKTTLIVSDVDHVIGGFNAALERNYAVCMDEALFSSQKKAMDRLKSFITEAKITVEQKYLPRRSLDSIHRFFAATNHEHFGNIELDSRRFVFLDVSNKFQKNDEYFEILYDAINNSTEINQLYSDLLSRDIVNFKVRKKPETKALLKQKLKSLNGFPRYWYEVLTLGYFDVGGREQSCMNWRDPNFISSNSLSYYYKNFQNGKRQYDTIQFNEIGNHIKKWCTQASSDRKCRNSSTERGYQLPSLIDARKSFENVMGRKITWP